MTQAFTFGDRVVSIARSQVGVQERDAARFLLPCVRAGRRIWTSEQALGATVPAWCAGFGSWCVWVAWDGPDGVLADGETLDDLPVGIRDGGASAPAPADGSSWAPAPPIGYRAAVREHVADARACSVLRLPQTASVPQPGDILIFGRDGQSPLRGGIGHEAICTAWGLDGWGLISGNDADEVRERQGAAAEPTPWGPLLAWISIASHTSRAPSLGAAR